MGWVEPRTARELRELVFLTGIGMPCACALQAFRSGTPPSTSFARREPRDDPMYARAVELLERFGAVCVEHPSAPSWSICAGPTNSSTDGAAVRSCVWRVSTTVCTGRRNSGGGPCHWKLATGFEAHRGTGGGDRLTLLRIYRDKRSIGISTWVPLRGEDAGRRGGALSLAQLADLMTLDLANRLEQLPRTRGTSRR
jgi:hypothetical protein